MGLGSTKNVNMACPIESVLENADLPDEYSPAPRWISIAGGRDHSLAVSRDGFVYVTGSNAKGCLGLPVLSHAIYFSKLHTAQSKKVSKVFAGVDHSFILLEEIDPS